MKLLNFITWYGVVITNSLTTPPVFAALRRGTPPMEGNFNRNNLYQAIFYSFASNINVSVKIVPS